jgi:hypothetical protein
MYQAYRFFPNNRDLFGTEHTLKEKLGNSVTGLADETLFYSGNIFSPMVLGSLVHTSTVMFRKTKMDEIGYLREDFKICEDYEYFLRITKSGPVAFVDCPTIEYRIGEEDALSAPKNAIVFSAVFLNMLRGNLRNETVSLPPGMIKQALSDAYAWVGNEKAAVDEHYMASKYLLMAVIHRPSTEKIKLLLVSLLPRSLRIWLKTFLKSKRKAHA